MANFADSEPSKIKPDGLRYKDKSRGSPFHTSAVGGTKSCFLCGGHKPIAAGHIKMMCGTRQFVCFGCRPPKVSVE